MTRPGRRWWAAPLAAALAAALLAGCGGSIGIGVGGIGVGGGGGDSREANHVAHIDMAAFARKYGQLPGVSDPYAHLARALAKRGVRIWFETDLVSSWLQGRTAFDQDLMRLHRLAKIPGVVGFKVADELGYQDGLESAEQARKFLTDARAGLQSVAPGAQLLVDVVVPELGCLPWRTTSGSATVECADRYRRDYPAASIDAITGYLQAGLIDRLDVSTGLEPETTYQAWGLTRLEAQREAWRHIREAGWGSLTVLQARKALAVPGGYSGSPKAAGRAVALYVRTPVAYGAKAVDIWAWRQVTDDQPHSLLAPDDASNPLWRQLARAHADGTRLFTHMRSSTMPLNRHAYRHECDLAAGVFSDVFVAAGTG
ncbi:MAG TPA: hypothetical protein VFJ19_21140 [Nocardioidaceae bacterium]|nr:hypothetical protein [Nocardioidaceae bacterium]